MANRRRVRAAFPALPFSVLLLIVAVMPAVLQTYAGIGVRIIRSGSMEPAYAPGDAVVVRTVQARDLVEGDVAVLLHPQDDEIQAHRILTVDEGPTTTSLVTKGDANPMSDLPVDVPSSSGIEIVALRLPKFGYVISTLDSPLILGGMCALGLVMLTAFEVHNRRRRKSVPLPATP